MGKVSSGIKLVNSIKCNGGVGGGVTSDTESKLFSVELFRGEEKLFNLLEIYFLLRE